MTGHWAKRVEVWGSTCFYLLLPTVNGQTVMVADKSVMQHYEF